jgi:hypothetical protein
MALVPIFRPAPFGLAKRWRDPAIDAKPAQPAPAHRAPAPPPADGQDEDEGPEAGRAVKQRLATMWGVFAICRRANCRRTRRCLDGGECIGENRAALQEHLALLRAHLRARTTGEPIAPPEPEAAPSRRRRRSVTRRKA